MKKQFIPEGFRIANGAELIAHERQEQIYKHGRTVDRDVAENNCGQLVSAAAYLILGANDEYAPTNWDVSVYQRIMRKEYKDRLVIAGALIAAEIDRLQAVES